MWNPPSQTVYNQNPLWADAEKIGNETMENAAAGN